MDRLKAYRKANKLSLRELGEKVGVSAVTIWDLEKGNKRAKPETAIKLEEVTGIERCYFIFGDSH